MSVTFLRIFGGQIYVYFISQSYSNTNGGSKEWLPTSTRSVVKCWGRAASDNYRYEPVMTQRDPY